MGPYDHPPIRATVLGDVATQVEDIQKHLRAALAGVAWIESYTEAARLMTEASGQSAVEWRRLLDRVDESLEEALAGIEETRPGIAQAKTVAGARVALAA